MSETVSWLFLLHVYRWLLGLRVVITEGRPMVQRIVVADELPPDLVVVAAVHRASQEPDDGVGSDQVEERRLLDLCERLDLLRGTECREFAAFRVELPGL